MKINIKMRDNSLSSFSAMILIAFTLNLVGGIMMSFPASYAFDFIGSQVNGCAVRLENPVARTALGFLSSYAGGASIWVPGIAKIVEITVPKTSEVFHGERCQ